MAKVNKVWTEGQITIVPYEFSKNSFDIFLLCHRKYLLLQTKYGWQ